MVSARMVSWWPYIAKRILGFAPHYHVRRHDDRTCRMKRSGKCMGSHRRIGIKVYQPVMRGRPLQGVDIVGVMNPQQLRARCSRSRLAHQMLHQPGRKQIILNRRQSSRTFRMMTAHVMQHAIRMMNERRRHGLVVNSAIALPMYLIHHGRQCPRLAKHGASTCSGKW